MGYHTIQYKKLRTIQNSQFSFYIRVQIYFCTAPFYINLKYFSTIFKVSSIDLLSSLSKTLNPKFKK